MNATLDWHALGAARPLAPGTARPLAPGAARRLALGASRPLALVLLVVALAPSTARAQSADEKEVVSVIERFFAGMLARDTAMMSSTVVPAARLVRVAQPQGGEPVVSASAMREFIAGVARRQGEGANERIYNPEVRIDGNMATVWTYYTLHVGEQFSHCGYDAFQLLRLPDGWKIVNVADTGRTEGCEVPGRPGVSVSGGPQR